MGVGERKPDFHPFNGDIESNDSAENMKFRAGVLHLYWFLYILY